MTSCGVLKRIKNSFAASLEIAVVFVESRFTGAGVEGVDSLETEKVATGWKPKFSTKRELGAYAPLETFWFSDGDEFLSEVWERLFFGIAIITGEMRRILTNFPLDFC